ncbi:MAG TPA: alpha/beta hydrolase [Streptosporangiaceae bacterium]|jgi:pimeloyl-ACP methyl ester carboxylesterase
METTVTVGADKVWAEDSGGGRPVVILLHPGVGDAHIWDDMWPALTSRCRVIRYDVRGYGRSPAATEDYTLLGDLLQVMEHFQVTAAHVVGCSMGGGAAMELALTAPERVISLTLLCPGVDGYQAPEEPELTARWKALREANDEDGLVVFYQQLMAAAGAEPEVLEQLYSAVRAEANELRFKKQGEPIFDRLHEVSTPTVLLVGDADTPWIVTCDEEIARRIPGCRFVKVPGGDHMLPMRTPELLAAAVLDQVSGS